jgi:hypothetical protein
MVEETVIEYFFQVFVDEILQIFTIQVYVHYETKISSDVLDSDEKSTVSSISNTPKKTMKLLL